jgi:hypothetical protein
MTLSKQRKNHVQKVCELPLLESTHYFGRVSVYQYALSLFNQTKILILFVLTGLASVAIPGGVINCKPWLLECDSHPIRDHQIFFIKTLFLDCAVMFNMQSLFILPG